MKCKILNGGAQISLHGVVLSASQDNFSPFPWLSGSQISWSIFSSSNVPCFLSLTDLYFIHALSSDRNFPGPFLTLTLSVPTHSSCHWLYITMIRKNPSKLLFRLWPLFCTLTEPSTSLGNTNYNFNLILCLSSLLECQLHESRVRSFWLTAI